MANKKQTKKAHRKATRVARAADKVERKRNGREDVNQAAARIVREATED